MLRLIVGEPNPAAGEIRRLTDCVVALDRHVGLLERPCQPSNTTTPRKFLPASRSA